MQLVAPAGSIDALRASVKAGADAVYLGMSRFGARAKAANFDDNALKNAIDYAHLFGVKVFITLNTLIKDAEMSRALDMSEFAYKMGADAAIVQDLRLIKELKHRLPDFVLHASTQMGVHNADGATVLRDLGIKRAVLSREALPSDIAEIKKTGLEIEYFVQGALCVGFSGNCYFSSLASSYSGNRGKCMQLCRKPYIFREKRGYFLSAKDLCLYDKLKELDILGVDAIKIEGRMRSPEYAYQAVRVYKSSMPTKQATDALKAVFNRGDFCSGYLTDGAQFDIIYAKTQSNIGRFIGKADFVRGNKIGIRGFTPHADDGFKVMRNGEEVCGAVVRNGEIATDGNCKIGDELRRTFDGALAESIKNAERYIDVNVDISLSVDKNPIVTMSSGNVRAETQSEFMPQSAVSRAITEDDVKRVFFKTSEYPFDPRITVNISGSPFMPISALNELRRLSYDKLKAAILGEYKIRRAAHDYTGLQFNRFDGSGTMLMVESDKQLNDEILSYVDYVVLNPNDYSSFDIPKINKPVLLNLPITMRGADRDIICNAVNRNGIYGVVSNNLYSLNITDKPILLGTGHNIIGETDLPHVRSFETDDIGDGFAYVFGRAPVMTLCHCPYSKCINCSGTDSLTDESGRVFPMRRYKTAHCYWQLLNCVPHYLPYNYQNKFYDCTVFDKNTILKALNSAYDGVFTRGNMNKGLK